MRERLMLGYNHQLTFKVMQLHVWYATLSGMYLDEVTTTYDCIRSRLCILCFFFSKYTVGEYVFTLSTQETHAKFQFPSFKTVEL